MKLIIGLGNPGPNHVKARHNFGWRAIEKLKTDLDASSDWRLDEKFKAALIETTVGQEKIILAKPQTMMNLSGQAVKALADFYKIAAADIWVLHDDFDLPLGILRVSQGSGSAGHKGVESIIADLATKNFGRFRLGIHPIGQTFFVTFFKKLTSTQKFVLQKFSQTEEAIIQQALAKTSQAIQTALKDGLEKAKNQFN